MEACEFWSALSDDNDAHIVLQSHLATLIPSLISRLQLKEEQILQERIEEEAHASGEKEINFKPIHRRYHCLPYWIHHHDFYTLLHSSFVFY